MAGAPLARLRRGCSTGAGKNDTSSGGVSNTVERSLLVRERGPVTSTDMCMAARGCGTRGDVADDDTLLLTARGEPALAPWWEREDGGGDDATMGMRMGPRGGTTGRVAIQPVGRERGSHPRGEGRRQKAVFVSQSGPRLTK